LKKNIIFTLIVISILLLLVNIFVNSDVQKNAAPIRTENYRYEIDSIFISALDEYELDKNWIKKIPVDDKKNDSVKYVYQIAIPSDISVAEMAGDINSHFINTQSVFVSEELTNYGKTEVKVYSNGKLKLRAFIRAKKNLKRLHPKIALIVDCSKIYDEKEFEKYTELPYNFTALLLPSFQSFIVKEKLVSAGKKYAILISDKIEDEKYQLLSGFSKPKLETNIRNIISDFNDAGLFVIDKNSEIYNSTGYNFVKEQFSRRGKKLIRKDRFKLLTTDETDEAESLFNFFTAGKDTSVTYRILLSPANFDLLQKNIFASIKKGVKFIAD